MKINGVSFNEKWVEGFLTAESFATSPSTFHLFPELKSIELRQKQLTAIWNYFNRDKIAQIKSNDSREDVGQLAEHSIGASDGDTEITSGTETDDGAVKPRPNARGGGRKRGKDNV
jgi:hypothetical protein